MYSLASHIRDHAILGVTSGGGGAAPVGADPTGTIGTAAVNGSALTFMRSDAAPAFDMTITRNWTAGTHTFAAKSIHTLGLALSNGLVESSLATGASAYGHDLDSTVTRTSGFAMRLRNSADSKEYMNVTWDGRFAFGYGASVPVQANHVLSFLAQDSESPAGSPIYAGILGSVNHNDSAETVTRLLGLVGSANLTTTTGLSAVVVTGVLGHMASSSDTSVSSKVMACFSGSMSQTNALATVEPTTKDITFGKSAHPQGEWGHVTVLWAPNFSFSSATGYPGTVGGSPTGFNPLITSSARLTIQDWGATLSSGTPEGEYWAIRGEHINGTQASYPAHTGYIRMTYPRRTGGTGCHAVHAWWEPWDNPVRANAIDGDTYFSDGAGQRKGLWEYAGAWYKLLQHVSVDAISGAAAPATLALTTGGGTGPANAAQNTWLNVVGVNGTTYWIPAWT